MLVTTQGLKVIKKKFQRDILKGKPIDWHHFSTPVNSRQTVPLSELATCLASLIFAVATYVYYLNPLLTIYITILTLILAAYTYYCPHSCTGHLYDTGHLYYYTHSCTGH
jgi:hypothetical protein